jgi:hypothetical protein
MNGGLSPTAVLDFEPEQAKSLSWLPLAIRHKLDDAGLRLTLRQWQDLPDGARRELLRRMPGDGFATQARAAGASAAPPAGASDGTLKDTDLAVLFGCSVHQAQAWLAAASPFARYAVGKRMDRERRA